MCRSLECPREARKWPVGRDGGWGTSQTLGALAGLTIRVSRNISVMAG